MAVGVLIGEALPGLTDGLRRLESGQGSQINVPIAALIWLMIPLLIQVHFNSSLTYGLMRLFRVRHAVAAPGALIGASNFFELAVAMTQRHSTVLR